MALQDGGGKLPGKTKYSGRRRTMTRKSGFKSHQDSTGGEVKIISVDSMVLPKGESLILKIEIPQHVAGDFVGFGGWFSYHGDLSISVSGWPKKDTFKSFPASCWGKFGSMVRSESSSKLDITITISAKKTSELALWEVASGIIDHEYYDAAVTNEPPDRLERLLNNMYTFSPEAHFFSKKGSLNFCLLFLS